MAEGETRSNWTSNVLCRYYVHGVCREGEHCRYAHDTASAPADNVCRFYLRGACTYGSACRYDHVRPQNPPTNNNTSRNLAPNSTITSPSASKPNTSVSYHQNYTPNPQAYNPHQSLPPLTSTPQPLTKPGFTPSPGPSSLPKNPNKWIEAAEFVPGQKWKGAGPVTYLDAAQCGVDTSMTSPCISTHPSAIPLNEQVADGDKSQICPYHAHGECRFGENCTYTHGDVCDMCGQAVLHPEDKDQREKHIKECEKSLEEDMELSFAVQKSKEKSCGICMDIVWEKEPHSERRFGILSNCTHVFCLSCIRKWRSAKQFENRIVRACPECRVKSDFVTPSKYWVDDKDEKVKLIEGYKTALSQKKCKYFDEGRGECPFNENCFYLHSYPDGRKASPKPIRRRRRQNAEGEMDLISQLILWDFLEERNSRMYSLDFTDLDDFIFQLNFADSSDDESEYSDFDFLTL